MSSAPSSPPSQPPEAWEPLLRLAQLATRPLERFLQIQAASGVVLVLAAVVAVVLANSPLAHAYHEVLETEIGLSIGSFSVARSVEWVVNDVLMVVFFFVVGLEIRREIHHGELSEWRRAALPVVAAIGGMLAPAALYLTQSIDEVTHRGWGVSMATDIAFAVGVLALLGKRVPAALRVLLLALAVIDDLGAIVVIAIFYSNGITWSALGLAGAGVLAIVLMQRLAVRSKLAYVLPGFVVWLGIYLAGAHPTVAGVILGFMTPVRAWLGPDGLVEGIKADVLAVESRLKTSDSHELHVALRRVDELRRETMSPSESLIVSLHPWVAFGIMPLFALANAGVSLGGVSLDDPQAVSVMIGVSLGLLVGKPLGVGLSVAVAVATGLCRLPRGIGGAQIAVLGLVAGIGFTMSLFIAQLAFTDPDALAAAKLGVLAASVVSAVVALVVGRAVLRTDHAGAADTADEAESSSDQ